MVEECLVILGVLAFTDTLLETVRENPGHIEEGGILIAYFEHFVKGLGARSVRIDLVGFAAIKVLEPTNRHDRFACGDKTVVNIEGELLTGGKCGVRLRTEVVRFRLRYDREDMTIDHAGKDY